MGLILSRKRQQEILLTVAHGTTADELLAQLQNGITVAIVDIQKSHTQLSISAPSCLKITRPDKNTPHEWRPSRGRIKFTSWLASLLSRLRARPNRSNPV